VPQQPVLAILSLASTAAALNSSYDMKLLVLPDKFKGTLTAQQAAYAIARGWGAVRPHDELDLLPMSDGGDGFGEIMSSLLGALPQVTATVDAAHRPCQAIWWWHEQTRTAIVESARVIGLAQLPPGKYHPFDLDTEGLAGVLQATANLGAKRCIVGIGGSATNDAGFGVARGLGWTFLDERGEQLKPWTELNQLTSISQAPPRLFDELIVAVDVQNPLLGPEGCTRIYGPQKGLNPGDMVPAERCLERLASVVQQQGGLDFASMSGAGAAGGLGFGLLAFAQARLVGGFQLFAGQARLPERLRNCDLVITAEGAIDRQTLMGKGVGQVATLCREIGVPCLGFAGVVHQRADAEKLFAQTHALTDITSGSEAMARPDHWLERLAARAAEQLKLPRRV
jgi:glycerate 2-kinase